MSKHDHHPNEGDGGGGAPVSDDSHLRQSWFYYVAGFFLMIALIGFILEGVVTWRPNVSVTQPATSSSSGK